MVVNRAGARKLPVAAYTRSPMAEKPDKPKKKSAKSKGKEKGVMAALPSTRPDRIGSTRDAPNFGSTPPPQPAATATPDTPGNGKPAAKRKAKAKATATPKATAARRRAAAPRTFEPTAAAEAAAGAADERAAGAVPVAEAPPQPRDPGTAYPRPRPVSSAAPGIGGTGYRDEAVRERRRPRSARLAADAARTAGDIARVGVSVGGKLVKRALERLPRP